MGVRPNAEAEPDIFGFEVKQHRVTDFGRFGSARITLLTPEPNGGSYYRDGAERFIRRYGRAAADGNRIDFAGTHRVGVRHQQTGLTLTLVDFNAADGIIVGERGRIALVNDEGEEAASWGFTELMEHWARKHAHAVYVPCRKRIDAPLAYSYGARIRLAQEPDFLRLLTAMANGQVRYDPGSKIENAAAARSQTKARSQFRIGAANIAMVYARVEAVNACG